MNNKKILIVFSFLFLFVLLFSGKCSAANEYPIVDNNIVKNHLYVVQIQNGGYKLSVFTGTDKSKDKLYTVYSNQYGCHYLSTIPKDDEITIAVHYYKLSEDKKSWVDDGTWHDCHHDAKVTDHILESNVDIYNVGGTIFFQRTPLGIVAQKVQGLKLEEVMLEIVGILPLILVIVVSLVGLRKGLKTLSTLLHRA